MIDPAYVTAGALTGFVVGMTGVGGGALMTPILLLFFGVPPTTAIATDLWFAFITKLAGVGIHGKAGHVDWGVVRRLWMGSLPVAVLVVLVISWGATLDRVDWLTQAVGWGVLVTAFGLMFAPRLLTSAQRSQSHLGLPAASRRRTAMTVVAGALLGLSVALTSVGAGALGSVVLIYLYPRQMTPHRLVATDLAHAIPLAGVAGLGYLLAGEVHWPMLASLLVGSIPAIGAGSLLAQKMSGRGIQIALAAVLMGVGIKTLI